MKPRFLSSILCLFCIVSISHGVEVLTSLHSFGSISRSAANPATGLLQAADGAFYGTTTLGGAAQQGTLFRLNSDGSGFILLKSFSGATNDGGRPFGALIEGTDGALYGTTESGGQFGSGTVYRVMKDGTSFSILKSFSGGADGSAPEGAVLQARDGALYGTASGGGTNDNGVIFRMNPDGSGFAVLLQFDGTNGANPVGELIEASDGLLYGTTSSSTTGTNSGTIFRLQKDGANFSILDRFVASSVFKTNGVAPMGRLVEGTNGMLYGTTSGGGWKGMGTIYVLNKDGSGFNTLYHFGTNVTDGRFPVANLVLASDGFLYGTTYDAGTNGNGSVFRIAEDGSGYSQLASFVLAQGPAAGLTEGTNGILYGTTQLGGASGDGTVFSLQKDGSALAIIKSFSHSGDDGNSAYSSPVWAGSNLLFGTTRLGGASGGGSIYNLRFDGLGYTRTTDLGTDGGPFDLLAAPLVLTNGDLLSSRLGGPAGAGTVFQVDPLGANPTILYTPTNSATGQEFRASLILGSDGLLYGTTITGGSGGAGVVFRMDPDGSGYTILQSFVLRSAISGANPSQALLEASDGNIYGTTLFGGVTNRGVLFGMSKDGTTFRVLKSFGSPATDGEAPMSALIEGTDGALYGTTYGGGSPNNGGTVFRINKDGTAFRVILTFDGANSGARHPSGNIVEWSDGSLYGTTERGGGNDHGTIFRVNKDGTGYSVVAELGGRLGAYPEGGLEQGPDGSLYGATSQGGDMNFGTIFRYGPAFGDIATVRVNNHIPIVTSVGLPGTNYVVERTFQLGPLQSWTTVLVTNAPPTGRFSVADQTAGASQSFYRVRW